MKVPVEFPDRSVCVMGLGYVGLTLAVVMAEVGFDVLGVEIRPEVVAGLKRGDPHFFEPGLQDKLRRMIAEGRLKVTERIPADPGVSVYIITVGTPLGRDGRARLDMIDSVCREVAQHLKDGDMVIMRSTVKVGVTRGIARPLLEGSGARFDLAFCPERTIEGKALLELRSLPQIVGGVSMASTLRASQVFQFLTPTVVRVQNLETAEMIKLIDNTQRDVHFAFANEVARMCNALGVSAAEVIRAGKLGYPRTNLPMPGPVGGPCLEKDPHVLVEAMRERNVELPMTMAGRALNESQPRECVSFIRSLVTGWEAFPDSPVISLMGIAFKGQPATDDLRGTMARPILDALIEAFPKARMRGYDPVVAADDIRRFGLEPMPSIEAAMKGAHVVVIANNHLAFRDMPVVTLAKGMTRPGLIYDFWNNFPAVGLDLPDDILYVPLGSHGLVTMAGGAA